MLLCLCNTIDSDCMVLTETLFSTYEDRSLNTYGYFISFKPTTKNVYYKKPHLRIDTGDPRRIC